MRRAGPLVWRHAALASSLLERAGCASRLSSSFNAPSVAAAVLDAGPARPTCRAWVSAAGGSADGLPPTPPAQPGPPPPSLLEIKSLQDFQAVLQLSQKCAVILDAYATWCGPCKQLDPVLRKAVEGTGGAVILAKLDIDSPGLAPLVAQMQITSVPTMYLIFGGRLLDTKQGVPPQQELLAWVSEIAALSREQLGAGDKPGQPGAGGPQLPVDELLSAGFAALDAPPEEQPSVQQLAQLFGQVLQAESGASDSQKAAAWAGMALCAMMEGNLEGAKELIESAKAAAPQGALPDEVAMAEARIALAEEAAALPQGSSAEQEAAGGTSKDLEGLYAQALRQFAAHKHREAVDSALAIVRQDRDWREQAGKQLALRLFDALGPSSELAKSGRRRLSNYWFV